jgi:hypothetical protein
MKRAEPVPDEEQPDEGGGGTKTSMGASSNGMGLACR